MNKTVVSFILCLMPFLFSGKILASGIAAGETFVVESDSRLIGIFDIKGRKIEAEIVYKAEKGEVKINEAGVFLIALADGKYLKVVVY